MRFLLRDDEPNPYRATECWLISEGEYRDVKKWRLALRRPSDPTAQTEHVDDFKRWVLFGDEDERRFPVTSLRNDYKADARRGRYAVQVPAPDWRQYRRDEVLQKYLDAVVDAADAGAHHRLWVLMPAIADTQRRKRYLNALRKAKPDIRVLPEPEMVVEYFRLVRRELTLERGRNSIFLVIDVGASTCNMTFVLTRQDEMVVGTSEGRGRQRDQRLRAAHADSSEFAGRWVDEQLAASLGIDLSEHLPNVRRDLVHEIERAKIRTSERGEATRLPEQVGIEGMVTQTMLARTSDDLWAALAPLYRELAQRLFDQLSGTEAARARNAALFEQFDVQSGRDIGHLIDTVILAGGTSQLPGFEASMRSHLGLDRPDMKVLRVGPVFATAAAVGALAHVLRQHTAPPRLRLPEAGGADGPANLADADFDGTLSGDLVLRWGANRRHRLDRGERVLLESGEPFSYDGGERPVEQLPAWPIGAELSAALDFRPESPTDRRRPRRHAVTVRRTPPDATFQWNADDRVGRLQSTALSNLGALHIDLKRFDVGTSTTPPPPPPIELKAGEIGMEQAPEIIIDLGMSKTVVVTAETGHLDVARFEASRGRGGFHALSPHTGTDAPEPEDAQPSRPAGPPAEERSQEPHAPTEPPTPSGRPSDKALAEVPGPPPASAYARLPAVATGPPERRPPPDRPAYPPLPNPTLNAFGEALGKRLPRCPASMRGDLVALTVALLTRPFVLLAGPPGCGKSTLVRTAGRLLGLSDRYDEIEVQARWRNAKRLDKQLRPEHSLVLLDEVNLTRPELYLWSLVNSLASTRRAPTPRRPAREMWVCGTLNVDDMSRPPSPKVVDRSFLLEMDAPRLATDEEYTASLADDLDDVANDPIGRPTIGAEMAPPPESWRRVGDLASALVRVVTDQHLRQDLLPSHRALSDTRKFLAIHHALSPFIGDHMSADDALDRALAGRFLVKLSGAAEQVEPLIETVESHLPGEPNLTRCHRRLRLARAQCGFGFVSPWQ